MGQFSWLDCAYNDKRHAILDNVDKTSYVLLPPEFSCSHGRHIKEDCYDGYGHFGGHDIYDLVVDWNRKYLSTANLRGGVRKSVEVAIIELLGNGASDAEIVVYLKKTSEGRTPEIDIANWKRHIGIAVACYDDQNEELKYPIKITYDSELLYDDAEPSLFDPNQGWGYDEYYYEYYDAEEEDDWY